jgi:hypothetical protein
MRLPMSGAAAFGGIIGISFDFIGMSGGIGFFAIGFFIGGFIIT